jgi:hypothetical protein
VLFQKREQQAEPDVGVAYDIALLQAFNSTVLLSVINLSMISIATVDRSFVEWNPTSINIGPGRSEILAKSSTFVVCVAEKSIVWRSSFGKIFTICLDWVRITCNESYRRK